MVRDSVAVEHVVEFRYEVEVSLVRFFVHVECSVSWTDAWVDEQRSLFCERVVGLVDAVDPNQISPEIGYEDGVFRGVEEDLVGTCCFLGWVGTWCYEREKERLAYTDV